MRAFQALAIALVFLLARSNGSSVTPPSKISTPPSRVLSHSSHPDVPNERRIDTPDSQEESSTERNIWTYAKALWWAETGKTDAYVIKKLNLNGLSDAAVKSNKYYALYRDRTDWYNIVRWLKYDYTTSDVWRTLKLNTITEESQLHDIRYADDLNVYMRFVKHFNRDVVSKLKNGYKPRGVMTETGASKMEMFVRVSIMADAGMTNDYAKVFLGLTAPGPFVTLLRGQQLLDHPNYIFYEMFLVAKKTSAGMKKNK